MIEECPSSLAGVTNIMRSLHAYVPSKDKKPIPLACFGDGMSCERMNDARNHNSCAESPWDRLEGLIPVAQDFHRRVILMQACDLKHFVLIGESILNNITLPSILLITTCLLRIP